MIKNPRRRVVQQHILSATILDRWGSPATVDVLDCGHEARVSSLDMTYRPRHRNCIDCGNHRVDAQHREQGERE